MQQPEVIWFPSSDGEHPCAGYLWQPQGEIRGVVQIVHGIAEHMGRYDHFARYLNAHGYVVCGEDHLGHGKTGEAAGQFGFFARHDGWDIVAADVWVFRSLMSEEFDGIPYFLLGHSMGSFLTRTYLCRYPGTVDGAILSGTGQESPLLVATGRLVSTVLGWLRGPTYVSQLVYSQSLGVYNRQFRPNRTTVDWMCSDERMVDAYLQDPLCSFIPSVGLFRDMLGGLRYISSEKALSRMDPNTPIYLFSGDQDPVGANGAGVRRVYGYFKDHGTRDLELKLYPGARHETLNETNRMEVYADVLDWLDRHCK
ncbi:MAG TPA: lysophospholipase [Candidatus Enterenecus faecium]|uniref:Lysophospholipase n=1 Tax=Candidatus Enterenecus faecium TaxID=2840780 RepID=A0A9D0YQZ8_9FIRM|nr:lysophospholipase [Candidatus Enterenecus faecium]